MWPTHLDSLSHIRLHERERERGERKTKIPQHVMEPTPHALFCKEIWG